ncbi:MAG: hypothetical protein ABI662_01060 [Dermatophilaceae bacterium]
MAERSQSTNGTVAEEAARLIEAMASMARSSVRTSAASDSDVDGPAREASHGAQDHSPKDSEEASSGLCSACGGERRDTPVACKLCPVCQGIAFIRSVRPETVDRLADFASAVASTLRDVASQTRASGDRPDTSPSHGTRPTVQDIHVDDKDEG